MALHCVDQSTAGALTREEIVTVALDWVGTPYHHQASVKHVGTDCLGLLRGVYRDLYQREPERPPPYSPDWAEAQRRETLLDAARRHLIEIPPVTATAGDVVAFRWRAGHPAKHIVILTSADRFIHASEGNPVCDAALTPWWRRRIAAAFSFPPRHCG